MSNPWRANDWFVVLHVNAVLTAATVFVFLHPEKFDAFAILCGTVVAFYQFMTVRDDKTPDAKPPFTPPGA